MARRMAVAVLLLVVAAVALMQMPGRGDKTRSRREPNETEEDQGNGQTGGEGHRKEKDEDKDTDEGSEKTLDENMHDMEKDDEKETGDAIDPTSSGSRIVQPETPANVLPACRSTHWAVAAGRAGLPSGWCGVHLTADNAASRNAAYLHAIRNGATLVLDLGADEHFADAQEGEMIPRLFDENQTAKLPVAVPRRDVHTINVLPWMSPNLPSSNRFKLWPHGFPMERANQSAVGLSLMLPPPGLPPPRIGVVSILSHGRQYLDCSVPPELHAFDWHLAAKAVIPGRIFAPFGRSTLFSRDALWALYLPSLVASPSVWRAYIVQRLLQEIGFQVSFSAAPRLFNNLTVKGERSSKEESCNLDRMTGRLVDFLQSYRFEATAAFSERAEDLYAALGKEGYISSKDVAAARTWLDALRILQYSFPTVMEKATHTEKPLPRLALVGKFNYKHLWDRAVLWYRLWSTVFDTVVAYGPFEPMETRFLQLLNVNVRWCSDDLGVQHSPVEVMIDALDQFGNRSDIDGVLFIHDDMLFNISEILRYDASIPWVTTNRDSLVCGNIAQVEQWAARKKSWPWWIHNVKKIQAALQDATAARLNVTEDSRIWCGGQSDFVYVPIAQARLFMRPAQWLVKHKIFLEIAFPAILFHFLQTDVLHVPLCTSWNKSRLNPHAMMRECSRPWHTLHPIKQNRANDNFKRFFDMLVTEEIIKLKTAQ